MNVLIQPSRSLTVILVALSILALLIFAIPRTEFYREWRFEGKAKIREGAINPANVNASPVQPASVAPAGPGGFTAQTRLGFTAGDQWEPAIAADRSGHVYMLFTQYEGVP